ncbi:hypothetical protein BDV59DRAFT_177344 [Aspergillus ambiguus]|uniref:uncharacterized protein n=1 Tax=Aspergillus ambiguus TaxID=176160 RepID=UPI003CCDEB72
MKPLDLVPGLFPVHTMYMPKCLVGNIILCWIIVAGKGIPYKVPEAIHFKQKHLLCTTGPSGFRISLAG